MTKLTAATRSSGDLFGFSVAINSDFIVAGASGDDSAGGRFYTFTTNCPPSITPQTISRQQGAAAANATIATLFDDLTAAGNITVALDGAPPAGISVTNPQNIDGVITADVAAGCDATPGDNPVGLQATDEHGLISTVSFIVNVTANTPPVLSYSNPAAIVFGSGAVINPATGPSDNGTFGVSLFSPGTFTGTVLVNNLTGVVTLSDAVPAGTHTLTIRITNNCGSYTDAAFLVQVDCPAIALSPLPGGTAGLAYDQTVSASPAGGGYTFMQTSGSLPPGLTFNGATGQLSGTPTLTGTYNFTIETTGFGGCMQSQNYALVINCPAITLSPASLPNATINTAYTQIITAAPVGATYSFALTSGLLPSGLTLNSDGSFSGAPTQSGVFNFRATATGFGACSGFRDYTLVVSCPGISITTASLPGGTIGTAYSQTVSVLPAGSYNFSVSSGALPPGLTLNAETGAISGAPAVSGSFSFTITASASGCTAGQSYMVVIACATITLSPAALPAGQAGIAHSQTINAAPAGSYTFTLATGSLPGGLTLNAATGVISGTPSGTGTFTFALKAQAANGCHATQSYTLVINCPSITLAPASLPAGTTGTPYSQTVAASPAGGSYSYTVTSGSLPAGLSLNSATGVVSGTPSANGSSTFTITATGFGGCPGSQSYTVVVGGGGGCPAITLPNLPNGNTGQLYSNSVGASPGGIYNYAVTAGSLPPGVTLYGSAGLLFGYPLTPGSYNFSITATGANNCTGVQPYTVVIGGASLQLPSVNDFSGDRRSDFVLWRATAGHWLIVDSATDAAQTVQWGQADDSTAPGDYDGDGKADLANFGQDGHWRIKLSSDGSALDIVWGLGTDMPVPGDYDGDGKTDLAVWRGTESAWYIRRSSDGRTRTEQWGASYAPYFDVAVPGDYDGDGSTDVAIFRRGGQHEGYWFIKRSSDGAVVSKLWGLGTDVAMPGDYDGDGQTDIGVWRGSDGGWYLIRSSDGTVDGKILGAASAPNFDVPAVGDYDGDSRADISVWRKSEGRWYIVQSSDGATRAVMQGQADDRVVTATPRQ